MKTALHGSAAHADANRAKPLAEDAPSVEGTEDGPWPSPHFAHQATPSLLCSSSVETAA